MLQKITDNTNLMRDTLSNAVVNIDIASYKNYVNTRKKMVDQNDQILSLDKEVSILRKEMESIKTILAGFKI